MKIEMEFQGLKELMKAFEDAASDEDIKGVNQKIVKQSEPVVKNIMSGKIPKSADIKLSGRGFGSKSSVTSHAADSIPLGAVKVKDTGASADVGWEKSDNSEHFYVKFINNFTHDILLSLLLMDWKHAICFIITQFRKKCKVR